MGRDSYDDMVGPERPRRKAGGPKVGLISVLGVLICAIIVLVVLILNPSEAEPEEAAPAQEPVSVTVREPEPIEDIETVEETSPSESVETPLEPIEPAQSPMSTGDVSAESLRPHSGTETVHATAVDLVSAQEMASFNSSDKLLYMTHVVQEGEDLQSIANAYGRSVDTLISVNRIRNLAAIQPGISLQIPNMDGRLYTVQEGDMLSTIAQRFSPSLGWHTLMEINDLDSENIRVGQELFIPATVDEEESSLQAVSLTFSSPLDGAVYASYGTLYDGIQLDGVLIGASAGSPVMASASGSVVDAGLDPQLGRFMVIQHDQGYKTSYYCLETVNVRIGEEVESGQVLGTIGTSGSFPRPTLYFKIEQGGIKLDPSLFF